MSSRAETPLEFYERLVRTHHKELLRLSSIWMMQRATDTVDFGRAEEAVQETFTIAWEKKDILMKHPNPIAWLNIALKNVIKNMAREDQRWAECLLRIPTEGIQAAPGADLELEGIISEEDMNVLKRLYLYGETYEEVCEDLGMKKSALAMRVKRSKELFRKNYGEIEKNISSMSEHETITRHEYNRGGSKQ